jgi:hypothetical protein
MTREDANIFANLAEDIDGAQMTLDAGDGLVARQMVEQACLRFKTQMPHAVLRSDVVLGRIMVTVSNEDAHEIVFVARRFE